jgi:sugar phosphate permease
LIPFWRDDFGLSYTQLGFILTLYSAATGIAQIPMGFVVDRVGALPVVVAGLVVLCGAIIGMGFVENADLLLPLALLGGAANGAFHPANYVIMAKAIQPARLGRSFAVHTFAGHIGNAVAPVTIIFLAVSFDWRTALITTGALGLVAGLAMLLGLGGAGRDEALAPRRKDSAAERGGGDGVALRFFFSTPVM